MRLRLALPARTLFLVFVFAVIGCKDKDKKLVATATCGKLEKMECRLGVVNTPKVHLGSVFWVNTQTKKSYGMAVVPVTESHITRDPVHDVMVEKFRAELAVGFSAKPPIGLDVVVQSHIQNLSQIRLRNARRSSLSNGLALLDANLGILEKIRAASDSGVVYFLVYSILAADSMRVELSTAQSHGVNVSTMNWGDYSLTVNYDCADELDMSGYGASVFFKAMPIRLVDANGSLAAIPNTQVDIDLNTYDLTGMSIVPPE